MRQSRRESPPSVFSANIPERAGSGSSPAKLVAVKHLPTWDLKLAGIEKESPEVSSHGSAIPRRVRIYQATILPEHSHVYSRGLQLVGFAL